MREEFLIKMERLNHIRILQGNDPCKLVISVKGTNLSGNELQRILLEDYHLQMEMAAESYVLGIVTMCDTKEGFDRLAEALLTIDAGLQDVLCKDSGDKQHVVENGSVISTNFFSNIAENLQEDIVYTLAEVREKETETVSLADVVGKVCADYVNLYPPGIPLFLPGERITKEHIKLINRYMEKGMHVQGITEGKIQVCK